MDAQRLDLGLPESVRVETFGEPGNRTFRILIDTGEGSVSLWLEKEQVGMLGTAVSEILERLPSSAGVSPRSAGSGRFLGELEVKVGELAVGYDREIDGFTLEASEFLTQFDITSIAVTVGRADFERIAADSVRIVTQGRPRCPMCGRPITDGHHFCPESNGHAQIVAPE